MRVQQIVNFFRTFQPSRMIFLLLKFDLFPWFRQFKEFAKINILFTILKYLCILNFFLEICALVCYNTNVCSILYITREFIERLKFMNRKFLRRTTVVLISVILLAATLFALASPVLGVAKETGFDASYIKQVTDVKIDKSQYYDGTVVQKLPSGVKNDDEISVIVQLDVTTLLEAYNSTRKEISFAEFTSSGEAEAIYRAIADKKEEVFNALNEKNINYDVTGVDYNVLISGFEIVLRAGDFENACKTFGKGVNAIVSEVYKPAETKLVENTVNVYETGIFNSQGTKYDGTGMVVAVLDTGLDYTHSAFSVNNFTADRTKLGLTRDMVAASLALTKANTMVNGLDVSKVYLNDKVPFSFDYADRDADVYSLHNNHGTHVSGVIVGKDDVITGVAPNAQLVSMKIFSDIQDSAKASWILDALEDCVILNVDVINMSLGTACGFSRESDKEAMTGVYDKIREQGISLVVAASNSFSSAYGSEKNGNLGLTSNPDTSTVGSPSTYEGAMSVASINGVKTPYILYNGKIIYFVESNNAGAEERDFVEDLLPDGVNEKEYEYILVPGAGRDADYMGMDVAGKIVLVERGSNTFEEKAKVAEAKGAAGIIIFNNVSGEIKMNVGLSKLAVCSISQADGKELAAAGNGKIKVSRSQKSGPFMSDFSSWGPSPSLGIKPEITAHGGNILSAVTGKDQFGVSKYDRLSGTSMACPNIAGVTILLRQYVEENYDRIIGDNETDTNKRNVNINHMVSRLMMSTADVVFNKNGLPYAVRKQGAGLANLIASTETTAYIRTYNKDGSIMDKSKLELGDDPKKTGVYTLEFSVVNFGTTALTYDLSAYVMTEGVSDVKTHQGQTTVTEEGYLLEGAKFDFTVVEGGTQNGNSVTVDAGKVAKIKATVKLTNANKKYLDESFANGMYVEGFVNLDAKSGTEIDLSVPYLAFYGTWAQAPLFDKDYYETNKDELDDTIPTLDKTLPDAYASRPIGGISEDYVSYLGSYYFLQNPSDKIISASRDYVAISNTEGTIHSIRFVWMGMLRNAKEIKITITDDTTGEVIFETVEKDVRKSYGDGGSYLYPANVDIEFDAKEHNLKNNTKYNVKLEGVLDYEDDGKETNLKNTFEFPLVTDFEAPALTGAEFYKEYDKQLKKDRLFVRMAIFDNHYSMAAQIGYVDKTSTFVAFDKYMTPIFSKVNDTTYLEFELTDYIYEIKQNAISKNSIVVACYDYALNDATYEIGLPAEFADFYFENTEITLSPNELYNLVPLIYPDTEWGELLQYTSMKPDVATVVNNKLVAVAPGKTVINVSDPNNPSKTPVKLYINVLSEGEDGFKHYDKPVVDAFSLTSFETIKAFFMVDSSERDIGADGDVVVFSNGNYSLSMYPSESVKLNYKLDAYLPNTTVKFESSDESIVTIDQNGVIVAKSEGYSSVTVSVLQNGNTTYYTQTVSIEVKDPFVTTSPSLTHYFGNGGTVEIPETLLLTEIGQFAFSNFEYVPKEPWELDPDDPSTSKLWYIGENTITKVIIPEGIKKINPYAFANLTALEEVVLPSTLEAIEYGAFYNCKNLKKVTGIENVMLINQNAFANCNLTGEIKLDSTCAVGDYAFAYNKNLTSIVLSDMLQSIGGYAFANNEKLESVSVAADNVKYGPYVFSGCKQLNEIAMNTNAIPEGAFYGCTSLTDITIGKDVSFIDKYAFAMTAVEKFNIASGNTSFVLSKDKDYILSADGKTLVAVSPKVSGEFEINDANVTTVGKGAFAYNTKITSVSIPSATKVEGSAFEYCTSLKTLSLGNLTEIGSYAFFKTKIETVPSLNNIVEIGAYAFSYTHIEEVTIPAGMKVGEGAFNECKYLKTVVIGDNAKLGMGAFMLSRGENSELVLDTEASFKLYYYKYSSALVSLTIGNNVEIGDSAFMGAANLETVVMGTGVSLGNQAFYNAVSLKNIDLSKVVSIGNQAFGGDILYTYTDANANVTAIDQDGYYIYRYYSAPLTSVDLSSLKYLGTSAFENCFELTSVKLGTELKSISENAFMNCKKLVMVNLENVEYIGKQAFAETPLIMIDLSSCKAIGEYAFINCKNLISVTLSENGTVVGEGAFGYCEVLVNVTNLNKATVIKDYAFAYTAITSVDLSSCEELGSFAFMKENMTSGYFNVTLGEKLKKIGDNPFAMCRLAKFSKTEDVEFNGNVIETKEIYSFDVSENVLVIDGSLYYRVPNGLVLIAYAGEGNDNVTVDADTVRVGAFAFAGTDVVKVNLPHALKAIGHKAFFGCNSLRMVVFDSVNAPILEEEFDAAYYESFENLPATGEYEFTDYEGNIITLNGLGIVPYYMWNVSDGKYSNAYYGANFVNQIGHGKPNLVMVKPVNGKFYNTFIYSQYFTVLNDGKEAAEEATLEAIEAINNLPQRIKLSDEALVVAARALYDKIASTSQRGLVTNYSTLISAENRILALKSQNIKPDVPPQDSDTNTNTNTNTNTDTNTNTTDTNTNTDTNQGGTKKQNNTVYVVAIIILSVVCALALGAAIALGVVAIVTLKKSKAKK